MKKQPKYSPEVIERAVRLVSEAGCEYHFAVGCHYIHRSQERLYA